VAAGGLCHIWLRGQGMLDEALVVWDGAVQPQLG
jgi:hypothetical protein